MSGVKFNHGRAVPDGDRVTALHTIAKIYAIDRDIELKHETLPALRPRACLHVPVDLLACGMQWAK